MMGICEKIWILGGILVLTMLTLGSLACSSESQNNVTTSTESNGLMSGTIEIDGSSTVFPITAGVAEEFRAEQPDVHVNVAISGTGGGFKRFTVGETAISNASRTIRDAEKTSAAEHNVRYIELKVAMDGLAVVAHRDNNFVDCLTVEELHEVWRPESQITNWNEIRASFPDKKLRLYGPDTDSGTFDYFTDVINGDEGISRSDYTPSADDNVLVQGISGDKNSLGYFGYAYYSQNQDKLKVLGVDNGRGCVVPNNETVANGTYTPLARPLFIYVNADQLSEREALREFVNFYLENAGKLSEEVGYTSLSSYSLAKDSVRNFK